MFLTQVETRDGRRIPFGRMLKTLKGAINQAHRLATVPGNVVSGDIIRIYKITLPNQSPLDGVPVRNFTVR